MCVCVYCLLVSMYDDAVMVVPLLKDALSESTLEVRDDPAGLVDDEDIEKEAELLECEPPLKQVVQGQTGLFVRGGGGAQ